jgi:C4-dicarboxylate-specific signal transduction histidine kinase
MLVRVTRRSLCARLSARSATVIKFALRAVLVLLICLPLYGQSADNLQKTLSKETEKLRLWATNERLVSALKQQNEKRVSWAEIERLDKEWIAGRAAELVRRVTTGPCADELRKLASDPRYGETFVMDNQGALVCASQKTSDYWQGDEAKWIRVFQSADHAPFVDRPKLDESTNVRMAQISLPINDGAKIIGVMTIGVRTDNLAATK